MKPKGPGVLPGFPSPPPAFSADGTSALQDVPNQQGRLASDRVESFRPLLRVLILGGVLVLAGAAGAREWTIEPGPGTVTLPAAVAAGDVVRLLPGRYSGPLVIHCPVVLRGEGWPILDGGGAGTVVRVTAPDVTIEGLVIRNSGDSLDQENSGLAVEAPRCLVRGNRFEETLFGIYLRRAPDSRIEGNTIVGMDLAVPRRGDPIRVWYSNGVTLVGNDVRRGRDVVLWYSQDLTVLGNTVREGRYGLHFMYCDGARIEGNRLTDNSVGAFLMYSRRLHMVRNLIAHNRGPSGYGIGLKDMDDAVVEDTVFAANRIGAYLDNSPRELDSRTRFTGCVFAYNDVGLRMLPSVRRNDYSANTFLDNYEQVEVSGGGQLEGNEWAADGVGNFWSDYAGYDADGDGVGDIPYRAVRLFESLAAKNSALRIYAYGPAARALDFAAAAFPVFQPEAKLTDPLPRIRPTIPAGLTRLERSGGRSFAVVSAVLVAAGVWLGRPRRVRRTFAAGSARA